MLIRYRPEDVAVVIAPEYSGKTVQDVLEYGGDIPVVASFADAKRFQPNTLVLGGAPPGGEISDHYRTEIISALKAGCNIISGMHAFLNDDLDLKELAKIQNVTLTDLRMPPNPPHFPKGNWMDRKSPVLLVVGSDCDTGKMTTAWELTIRLRKLGIQAEFFGTGQTGILLSGNGVPVDAVVSDFMAGEIEYAIDQIGDCDLIIVEGQGSITNQYYSGVTLGLLHGAMPDFMIMTHEPTRELDVTDYPMMDLKECMDLHIDLMKLFKKSRFLGFNLLTSPQDDGDALQAIEDMESSYGIPATDLVRFGNRQLIDSIAEEVRQWN